MRINIDPVVSSRIKTAWAALPPDQQNRIAPLLANANQFALMASQTKTAPPFPMLGHEALLAKSALTDDRDGVLKTLQPDIIFDVGSEGEIWGTGKYQQLDPGWAGSVASWLEHLLIGKHAFNNAAPEIIIPNQVQIGIAGDWGTGEWRTDPNNPAPSADVGYHLGFLKPQITIHLGDVYYAGTKDEEQHLLVQLWPQGSIGWGCKSLSVICLSSLRLHPSGVRRSGGERSEPSAAEPRRGGGAPRAKNWSRAGQAGSLLGCRETHPTQNQNDPPKQS